MAMSWDKLTQILRNIVASDRFNPIKMIPVTRYIDGVRHDIAGEINVRAYIHDLSELETQALDSLQPLLDDEGNPVEDIIYCCDERFVVIEDGSRLTLERQHVDFHLYGIQEIEVHTVGLPQLVSPAA